MTSGKQRKQPLTGERIRAVITEHLRAYGFAAGTWEWVGTELVLLVEGRLQRYSFKPRMKMFALSYEMGRIQGLADGLGLKPRSEDQVRINRTAAINGTGDQIPLFATA